jgi:hypothetical protein
MNTKIYRKLRQEANTPYILKNPDSDTQFLLLALRNELNYLRFLLKDEKIDPRRRKTIEEDISMSDVLIESLMNE